MTVIGFVIEIEIGSGLLEPAPPLRLLRLPPLPRHTHLPPPLPRHIDPDAVVVVVGSCVVAVAVVGWFVMFVASVEFERSEGEPQHLVT